MNLVDNVMVDTTNIVMTLIIMWLTL